MNKIFCVVFSILMVFWITSILVTGKAVDLTTSPSKGDLNGDGAINAIDVHIAGQMVAGIIPSDKKVDFNNNNRVDIGDVAILGYYVMTGNPPPDYANIPARTSGYETVSIGSYTATTGSRVIVPISIKNVKKVIGFSLDLFYDPNTISVQKVKANNSIITGSNVISNIDNHKGKTRIVLANINTITVSTATPTIDVILRNTGPGRLDLQNVEIVSSKFQLYKPYNIIDGRITIATPKTINKKPITPFKPILIIGIALIAIILILIAL
ncbi:MAG: cohesin domain-containing protein, partial [Methanosarcinales archaeon]